MAGTNYFMRTVVTLDDKDKGYPEVTEMGVLHVKEKGNFTGEILNQETSEIVQVLGGLEVAAGKDRQMSFTKNHPEDGKAVVYFLHKSDTEEEREGEYKGFWRYAEEDRGLRGKTRARMVRANIY